MNKKITCFGLQYIFTDHCYNEMYRVTSAFGNCLHSTGTILSGMWRNSQTTRRIFWRQCCPWTSRLHQQSSWWFWHDARFRFFTFCKSVIINHTNSWL